MLTNRSIATCAKVCLAALAICSHAQAQINLTGSWINWTDQDNKPRNAGPDPVTFVGIPINEVARDAALAYSPETVTELDRQCAPWPLHYILMGPMPLAIWPTKRLDGSVLAWNLGGAIDRYPITIWMDGRSPPSSQAANTASGFTTGHWQGDTLVTTTTHIQDGLLSRNGVPSSNREVFRMFITRHDDWLTITGIVHDPVYLTAPYVVTGVFTTGPSIEVGAASSMDVTCMPAEEDVSSASSHRVPSYLTPPSDSLTYANKYYGIPQEAALGGAQTMYPEYIKRIQSQYRRPSGYCSIDCCGAQGADGRPQPVMEFNIKVLQCKQDNP